jgi:hypothetical protein
MIGYIRSLGVLVRTCARVANMRQSLRSLWQRESLVSRGRHLARAIYLVGMRLRLAVAEVSGTQGFQGGGRAARYDESCTGRTRRQ